VKHLACRDAGFACDAVIHGETFEDVMRRAGPHLHEVHGASLTPELAHRIAGLVSEDVQRT
jgi:predicted small metal-binding protein